MKTFRFTRQQEEFITADEQIVIASGSVGAGKSLVIGADAYATAIEYPNSRILITRDNFTDLRKSTIQTLLSKVIPKENVVEHNKSEHRIVVKSSEGMTSEIWYEGLDKGAADDYPTKIGSTEFNKIYVDEGFELDKGDFQFLLTRLRHEAFNSQGERCNWQIKTATNPGGPTHWMKTDYIDQEEQRDDIKVVHFLTEDNEFIDKEYLQNLKQQYPDGSMMHDRLLRGKWVASEGLVYPNFDMEDHVVSKEELLDPTDYKRVVAGADSGWKNPRVILVIGVTGSGKAHVLDEFYRSKTSVQDAVEWMNQKSYEIKTIYHDPSEPEEIEEYKKAGFNCKKAVNDIIPGITETSKYFAGTDGKNILIGKHCTNFINELLSYRYPEGTTNRGKNRNEDETPIKENDHACDSLRYCLQGLKSGGTKIQRKTSPFAKKQKASKFSP